MEKVNQQIPQGNYVLLNSPNSKGGGTVHIPKVFCRWKICKEID